MADTPTGLRRIVTGHDANGKAVVIEDAPTPGVKTTPNRPGVVFNNMWRTESEVRYDGPSETVDPDVPLPPPPGGTMFRIIEFPPESKIEQVDAETARKAFQEYGAGDAHQSDANSRHAFMHRTETVDYAICLKGTMTMLLDDSEVVMHPGDTMIQRGTNHAWANRGDEPCLMAFVLIDAKGERAR